MVGRKLDKRLPNLRAADAENIGKDLFSELGAGSKPLLQNGGRYLGDDIAATDPAGRHRASRFGRSAHAPSHFLHTILLNIVFN
ncbi:MAG TPA: hypothetical protein VNK48_10470 [Xanthobacteraceae bacterium]|nr:hypothetical protein [Xanthobacteraceae bacterium]